MACISSIMAYHGKAHHVLVEFPPRQRRHLALWLGFHPATETGLPPLLVIVGNEILLNRNIVSHFTCSRERVTRKVNNGVLPEVVLICLVVANHVWYEMGCFEKI